MTKKDIHFQNAACFLMFSAMSEIMLGMYEKTDKMIHYDPYLHTKLKNLRANFEKVSKKAFLMFPDNEQLDFMDMINVFEKLIESSQNENNFFQLMGLIKSWQKGQLTMINTKDELLGIAENVKENNIDPFEISEQ
jgi:hypothetical protein